MRINVPPWCSISHLSHSTAEKSNLFHKSLVFDKKMTQWSRMALLSAWIGSISIGAIILKRVSISKSKSCLGRKDTTPETQDTNHSGLLRNPQDRVDEVSPEIGDQYTPSITIWVRILLCTLLCALFGVLDFVSYVNTGKHWLLADFLYVLPILPTIPNGCIQLLLEKWSKRSK